MRTPNGALHIAWTCLACEFINCWNWQDKYDELGTKIDMTCDNCGRVTEMNLKRE